MHHHAHTPFAPPPPFSSFDFQFSLSSANQLIVCPSLAPPPEGEGVGGEEHGGGWGGAVCGGGRLAGANAAVL